LFNGLEVLTKIRLLLTNNNNNNNNNNNKEKFQEGTQLTVTLSHGRFTYRQLPHVVHERPWSATSHEGDCVLQGAE